jgi:hypothetical protein
MNKQNLITLNELANSLNEKGFYKEANIIHEQFIKLSISPDDILMPGEYKPTIESDDSNVEISLNDIQNQFITMVKTIQSLPDTHDDGEYFGRLKSELLNKMYSAGSKLGSLFTEAGLSSNSLDNYMDSNM